MLGLSFIQEPGRKPGNLLFQADSRSKAPFSIKSLLCNPSFSTACISFFAWRSSGLVIILDSLLPMSKIDFQVFQSACFDQPREFLPRKNQKARGQAAQFPENAGTFDAGRGVMLAPIDEPAR